MAVLLKLAQERYRNEERSRLVSLSLVAGECTGHPSSFRLCSAPGTDEITCDPAARLRVRRPSCGNWERSHRMCRFKIRSIKHFRRCQNRRLARDLTFQVRFRLPRAMPVPSFEQLDPLIRTPFNRTRLTRRRMLHLSAASRIRASAPSRPSVVAARILVPTQKHQN